MHLGNALAALGELESGIENLQEAIAAYGAALQEWTRDRDALHWAMAQNNLGIALELLGEREGGTETLQKAVSACGEALKEWTRDRVPLDWAESLGNQGIAMMVIADRTNDVAVAETASGQIETAYKMFRAGHDEPRSAYLETKMAEAHAVRDRLKVTAAASRKSHDDVPDCKPARRSASCENIGIA